MATVSVVFTKLANSPADFISTSFSSETIASGATSVEASVGYNYVMLTALGGSAWAAFTVDGSEPDPTDVTKRLPLPENTPIIVSIKRGTRVGVTDMT